MLTRSILLVIVCCHAVEGWCMPNTYGEWKSWSSCSNACGGGIRRRNRYSCVLNEKDTDSRNCNQFCYNGGTYVGGRCRCPTRRSGRCCESYQPCHDHNGGCSDICRTIGGQSRCTCRRGYTLRSDGISCTDVDECKQNACGQLCTNTVGSFRCACRSGFLLEPDGRDCRDINECTTGVARCGHICTNTAGSFRCSCKPGFKLRRDGRTCTATSTYECIHSHTTGECQCISGYRLGSDNKTCKDIDECTEKQAHCGHKCVNTPGSFDCSCNSGYQLGTDRHSCIDVDECAIHNGQCPQKCINEPGSFHCECSAGYRLSTTDNTCRDIDECKEMISGCSQTCTNADGYYTCGCKPGYQLNSDGKSCKDIDNCIGITCEHGGTCRDGVNSFLCSCAAGYTGTHCENDIDECRSQFQGGCEDICINTDGSFYCQCSGNKNISKDGFTCEGNATQTVPAFPGKGLPRGCATLLLTHCSEGNDIELFLSSTSPWYRLRENTSVSYTFGIVFVELNRLSLPVSITGMAVLHMSDEFKIITGGLQYRESDGVKLDEARDQNCWSFDITPRDVHSFLSSMAFQKWFYNGVESILPSWLKFSATGTPIYDINGLTSEFMHGRDISNDIWCSGAPVFDSHLYTVLKFSGDISISVYGQTVTVPKPLHGNQFCFIIDICQDYGGSFFLMLPPDSRDILEMIDIFKSLRDSKGIQIRPRGVGVSLLKNINVRQLSTSPQLWNGDELFTYPMFPRANFWASGEAFMDVGILKLQAESDVFLSVPSPKEILHSVFFEKWDAYIRMQASASLQIKFKAFGHMHTINVRQLGAADLEAYTSLGGVAETRQMCGRNANPPGMYISLVVDVNPFRNIPVLSQFGVDFNTKLFAFFTTDPTMSVTETNRIDILEDVLELGSMLKSFQNVTIRSISSYGILLSNESSIFIGDINRSVTAFVNLVETFTHSNQFNPDWLMKTITHTWTEVLDNITLHVDQFVDSIALNNRVVKYNLANLVISETGKVKERFNKVVQKLVQQVLDIFKDYQGFGLRFVGTLKVFTLKFGLQFEVVHSIDSLGQCNKFKRVYEILHDDKSVRVLGVARWRRKLGFLLKMNVGAGLGMACSIERSGKCVLQFHAEANLLGITTQTDVFVDERGLQFYTEGNLYNRFKVTLEVFAEHGPHWEALIFTVRGRLLANTGDDNSFDDSYLGALRKVISDIGNEANKRLSQAQAGLTKAQSGITTAQDWLTEKESDVRGANKAFDEAIRKLEGAKRAVESAKEPFRNAIQKLNEAERDVDNLCRIRSCNKVCIPGLKCRKCWTRGWFKIPYPCCHFTSCMIKIPNLLCEAANLACRAIRGVAYLALEAAKIFVRVPMLALDVAKGALSVAEFVVDKSRVVLDIAVVAMELAKVGLEGTKGILEVAKVALEGVKFVVKVGLKVFDLIIKYGLQSLVDVKNCGFEIKLSNADLPVFEISCDVNAFRQGWRKIEFMINFNDPIQTLWQAAKSTVKLLADTLVNIVSGKKKREVEYDGLFQTYKVMRILRDAESEDRDDFESYVNETINVTYHAFGFKNASETPDDAKIRINIFKEKCSIFNNVFNFFNEANAVLLDIANETVTMMNNISSIQDELGSVNITDLQNNTNLEDFGIDAEVAMKDYNLTRDNMTSALENAQKSFANDSLLTGISSLAENAKSQMEAHASDLDNFKVTDQWMLGMENVTKGYFKQDECVSYLDCAHFAIAELYDLFYAQNLPNTTESLDAISSIEDLILDLTGNRSHKIRMVHNLTAQIAEQLQTLNDLALFCSEAPTFLSPLTNQTVKNGTLLNMFCNATGDPDPTVWWFKDGKVISDQHGSMMTINSSQTANLTMFQCMVGNIVANRTSDVAHIIIEENEDVGRPDESRGEPHIEKTVEKLHPTETGRKDHIVMVTTSVLGSLVGVAVIVGVVVWRTVLRHRFRRNKTEGSFASLNMVRPDSSKPNFRRQRPEIFSVERNG